MDESSSEKGGWFNRIINKFMHKESAPITTQARPMTPKEYLQSTKDIPPGQKGKTIIQMEFQARQKINQAREKKGRQIAAGAIGAAALAVGAVSTGAIPQVGEAINNTALGIAKKLDELGKPEPGTVLSDQARKNLDNSRVPEEPPKPLNPAMKGPQAPIPIPGLEKPKPV